MASLDDLDYCYVHEDTVTEEKLVAWKNKMGLEIPQQYREFLLRYKDGAVEFSRSAFYQLENYYGDGNTTRRYVTVFFTTALIKGKPLYDLAGQFFDNQGIMLDWLLPITNDAAGTYTCIAHKGENVGRVYVWDDYQPELYSEVSMNTHKLIAKSFSEFIEKLVLDEE